MNTNQRELQCITRDAKFEGMDEARLERSSTSHHGMLTKFINLATIMIRTLQTNPSQWAAQELERLKQQIDWKVEDIDAGYNILLAALNPLGNDYKRLDDLITTTIQKHAARPSSCRKETR